MSTLLALLVAILIIVFLIWLVRQIPLPAPWSNIAVGVIALLALIWLVSQVTGWLPHMRALG